MMNLMMNNKFLVKTLFFILLSSFCQAGPLLDAVDFQRLSETEQSQYLKEVQRIFRGSAKTSEFFVFFLRSLVPEGQSAALELTPQNYKYTIEALLNGLPYEKSEPNKFNTAALAKIYLWHAKKEFPSFDFSATEKLVDTAYNPIASKDLVRAEQLEKAYLQQGDATKNMAKYLWYEYKRKWDLQPGKNQIIVNPAMLNPLGVAIDPASGDTARALNFTAGRCVYAGFVIEGERCSPISKTPDFLKPLKPTELNDFKCEAPSQVLCNPLIFGCKMEKGLVPTPLCVPPSGNATIMCERRSDAMARVCALGIIKENPKAWDLNNKKLEEFCLPESITKNGFLYFKGQNGVKRSEASRKFVEKDLKETCETTFRELNVLKDVIRSKQSSGDQSTAK